MTDSRSRSRAMLPAIFGLAVAAAVYLLALPHVPASLPVWIVLGGMALVAEMMPVELWRGGVRLTFTLPYVAALAAATGPAGGLGSDVLATVVAAGLTLYKRPTRTRALWSGVNLAVAVLSVFCGSVVMLAAARFTPEWALAWTSALAFVVGYGISNYGLVALLDTLISGRPITLVAAEALRLGARVVGVYAVLALAVTGLVADGWVLLVPLTLVPVWALRAALTYQAKMAENYYGTMAALTLMLQRAHPYTHGHLERVAAAAEEVARMLGLSRQRARQVREAALLHDIGKIAVDEEVLDKPTRLAPDELEHVRMHSIWGAQILAPVRGFSDLVPWIRHHHERPDATGYPDRLSDERIPIESKIIAVVDAFDAMTGSDHPSGKRPYRDNMTVSEALAELERCSGTQFDARVVRAFRAVVEQGVLA